MVSALAPDINVGLFADQLVSWSVSWRVHEIHEIHGEFCGAFGRRTIF